MNCKKKPKMENNFLKEFTVNEMLAINGGHDGTAYNAGRAAAKLFKFALTLIAFRRLR